MDERIDIEVIDKVAKTIKPELLGISAAAKNAYSQIAKLKKELGVASTAGVAKAAREVTNVTKAVKEKTQAVVSGAKLERDYQVALGRQREIEIKKIKQQRAEVISLRDAEKQRANQAKASAFLIGSGSGKSARDSAGVFSAGFKAEAAAEREASRASAERARQAAVTAAALAKETAAAERLRDSYRQQAQAAMAQTRYNNSVGIGRNTKSAKDSFAVFEQAGHIDKLNNSLAQTGRQAGLARHHLLNLGFQLQDIFVSLASGQKPLTVFIQQGGQIGQIAAQSGAGLGGMARAIGGILSRFAPLALGLAAVAGGFALFKHSLNVDPEVKKIIDDLGLTAKEIKKLENTTVTAGDVIKATFQEIASNVGVDMSKVKSYFGSAMDFIAMIAKGTLAGIYASFVGTFNGIKELVKQGFKGEITSLTDVSKVLVGESVKAFNVADKALSRFGNNVRKRILANKQSDLGKQAAEIIAGRGPGRKAGKSDAERLAERQAEALRKLTGELEREQSLLAQHLVGIDATIADRMNSIADSLASVKIDLRAKEYDNLRAKLTGVVTEIERLKNVNGQLAQIYTQTVEPVDRWVDANDAAAIALERFAGDADKVALINRWLKQQEEAYLDATNPMRQYSKALLDQRELYAYFGRELEVQTEIQRRYNEQKALDPSLNPDKAAIGRDVRSDMKREGVQGFLGDVDRSANDNFREGGNQWIIDNAAEMYKRIDEMRKGDVESERNAAATKRELDQRVLDAKFDGTRRTLENLSTLQNAKSQEVVALAKGAAIALATYDAYKTINSILGDPTLPTLVKIPLAISTGAMAFANVASIAGIGFQKGGYTGDVPPHQSAGMVHGREYVMDAATTARIGVPTLDAMRNGRLNPGPAANNNAPRVTVINNGSDEVSVSQRSDGELQIMIDRRLDAQFGPTMQRHLSNPNSRASQSVGNNFKTRRNR